MSLFIKICGFTNAEEATKAAELGVDAIGLVLTESRRQVTVEEARRISRAVPAGVLKVGVFADAPLEELLAAAGRAGLEVVQLHGAEEPAYVASCIKTGFRVIKSLVTRDRSLIHDMERYLDCGPGLLAFLVDSYIPGRKIQGGSGITCRWDLAMEAARKYPVILAGGLHPGNIEEALKRVEPWGVDVSGGVEAAPGRKDPAKMAAFIQAARRR
ncbi:MAG TPA: phosphoribosylanthranilate isomerase [Firmicutes bacterium]|nr:phosphoribosylanthranilate isomerase [Bacillota bacterium]